MVHDSWWGKGAATMRQGDLYVWGCSNQSLKNKENKRDIQIRDLRCRIQLLLMFRFKFKTKFLLLYTVDTRLDLFKGQG